MKVRISLVVVLTTLVAASWAWGDGFNWVSWPLIVADTSPQAAFADSMGDGCQLTGAKRLGGSDYVEYFDNSLGFIVACWYKQTATVQQWLFEPPANPFGIEPDKMYNVVVRGGHPAVTLTMTGAVSDTNRVVPIYPQAVDVVDRVTWIGSCFPVACSLGGTPVAGYPDGDDADFLKSGFTGAKRLSGSDWMEYIEGGVAVAAWYKSAAADTSWKYEGVGAEPMMNHLEPGRGLRLWVRDGHVFTGVAPHVGNYWVYGVPPDYSKGALVSKTRVAPTKKAVAQAIKRVRRPNRATTAKRLAPEKVAEEKKTR